MEREAAVNMLLFDLDDTLVDDGVATSLAAEALFQHYWPEQQAQALQHWQRALKLYYPAFLQGQMSAAEMRQARAREVLQQPQLSAAQAEQVFEYFMQQYIASTQLYPDTLACLKELQQQGWRLALISNGPEEMQQRKVKAAGLVDFFEFVLTAEVAGAAKPKLDIFKHALRLANLPAAQCCYIGDHLEKDAQAAFAAGLSSIWLQRTDSAEVVAWPYPDVNWKIACLAQLKQCI
ncbi:HAD family hydrolase [Agarivorans sp. QJM3NY_25]|uniref:HAD family hydrolase n=1 Tax=Agarivorans sp. QJM3NY_25 TaxID=3421430 RepID=UPI003D7CE7F1